MYKSRIFWIFCKAKVGVDLYPNLPHSEKNYIINTYTISSKINNRFNLLYLLVMTPRCYTPKNFFDHKNVAYNYYKNFLPQIVL